MRFLEITVMNKHLFMKLKTSNLNIHWMIGSQSSILCYMFAMLD